MRNTLKLLLCAAIVTLAACNKNTAITEEKGFDYGTVANNKYTNTFFNIEMNVPAGWDVQPQQQRDTVAKLGREVLANGNTESREKIKAAEINSANLLTVYQYKMGTAVQYNPSFMFVAENLKAAPTITSAGDYLDNAKKLLGNSVLKIKSIDNTYAKKTVNGIELTTMNVTMDVNGMPVYQIYMVTIKDGFALGFVFSYGDGDQKTELEKVANSIAPYKQ